MSVICLIILEVSLKTVLLHNCNKFPFVSLAHDANIGESYENMKILLGKIQHEKYNWNICEDLKVVVLLFGLQLGYTKFWYFQCEWDSRDREDHYIIKQWPKGESLIA
jgi:hypothetical protein